MAVFKLYVAGNSPKSLRARANLEAICQEILPNRHEIEIVDVLEDPIRMLRDEVPATPVLVKMKPYPPARLQGDLSDRDQVIATLELD